MEVILVVVSCEFGIRCFRGRGVREVGVCIVGVCMYMYVYEYVCNVVVGRLWIEGRLS